MRKETVLSDLGKDMRKWRHNIHRHPELMYEEHRTAAFVAQVLSGFGIDVRTGIGKTGVVGTLRAGSGSHAIILRADLDALPIHEETNVDYCSEIDGKMHACGHDGHAAMLLGAAKQLSASPAFDGTVHFVFQPAEEGGAGAQAMIDDGLFDDFPVSSVYGMHNWPGMAAGTFATCPGPMMASYDTFEICVRGIGSHAAMPEKGRDPIPAGAEIISALQCIVSRNLAPIDAAVLSVTQIRAGDADNVIPDTLTVRGSARAFSKENQDLIENRLREVVNGICASHGMTADIDYQRVYPCLVNTAQETDIACQTASALVGAENVNVNMTPTLGSEDFSFMLLKKPGCHIFIGNGPGEGGCMLHNSHYDFNDDILTIGAEYWCQLVQQQNCFDG